MALVPLPVNFATAEDYLKAFETEISKRGLLVRGASLAATVAGAEVELQLKVVGHVTVVVAARVAAIVPGVGVAVMFDSVPQALIALEAKARRVDDVEKPAATVQERLKALNPTEKMALALGATRDERMALLRETNKMIHVYVLKNPRIGLDEVQTAAKMPTLSPDAIKMIADHREWGMNPTICAALCRNPMTPVPLALRLIDRVGMSDLRAIAKGGAREMVVHAARKKVIG